MENLEKKEITIGVGEANLKALILAFPVIILFGLPFILIWGGNSIHGVSGIVFGNVFITLLFLVIGTVLHELIHGIFWAIFLKNGFKSIKFGIMMQFLTPYCHCKVPLKLNQYRLGAIMPSILLGLIPCLISLINGSIDCLVFGMFFTVAAGGDLLMIWLLRKEKKNTLVQDLPDKIGCFLFIEEKKVS